MNINWKLLFLGAICLLFHYQAEALDKFVHENAEVTSSSCKTIVVKILPISFGCCKNLDKCLIPTTSTRTFNVKFEFAQGIDKDLFPHSFIIRKGWVRIVAGEHQMMFLPKGQVISTPNKGAVPEKISFSRLDFNFHTKTDLKGNLAPWATLKLNNPTPENERYQYTNSSINPEERRLFYQTYPGLSIPLVCKKGGYEGIVEFTFSEDYSGEIGAWRYMIKWK